MKNETTTTPMSGELSVTHMRYLIFSFALISLSISTSFACSCSRVSVGKEIRTSDLVFTGTVIEIKDISHNDTIRYKNPKTDSIKVFIEKDQLYSFKFSIKTLHKGKIKTDIIDIISSGGGADCGMYFDLGTSHLIYTDLTDRKHWIFGEKDKVDPYFITHLCTRTKLKSKVWPHESFRLFLTRLFS